MIKRYSSYECLLMERLNYTRRRKPVFPFEPDTSFDPEAAPR